MNDVDGRPVRVGDRVCVVRKQDRGKILFVRKVATMPGRPLAPAVRADDSKSGNIQNYDFIISVWLTSKEFAVIPPESPE